MSIAQREPAARDVMQRDPVRIAVDTPFLEVQHLFVVAQIGGAPVVADDGKVVGMISAVDLLRAVDQAYDSDVDGDPEALFESLRSLRATDVLSPEVEWVAPDTPVSHLARIMRQHGIHRVLVGIDGRLEGIVSSFDLLPVLEVRG